MAGHRVGTCRNGVGVAEGDVGGTQGRQVGEELTPQHARDPFG